MIDLVIRIELTREILMPWFSNFHRNSIINSRMLLYLVTFFPRVTVSLLCRLQDVSKIHFPIYPCLINEGRRNCSTLCSAQQRNCNSQEKCYHYKNKLKFLRKFVNRGIKIARVNSILITKSINLHLFIWFWTVSDVLCDVDVFKLTASVQFI